MDYRANHKDLIECRTCGATLNIETGYRTATCAYCASPNVVRIPATKDRPAPEFALAFVLPKERAAAIAHKWKRGRWFAPSAFVNAQVDEVRGAYLPSYLYSARAETRYSASIGENYTVTETYTDSKGKKQTRTRTETEWRPLEGRHEVYVTDRIVTASRGIENSELEAIEPFAMDALHRYSPKVVSGWIVEDASLSVAECAALGRKEASEQIGRELSRFMPGDKHRSLTYQSTFHEENIALTLVPIWVLPVRYAADKPMVRLLVNGQTGRLHGKQPISLWKVFGAAAGVVAITALTLFLLSGGFAR